MTTTLLLPCGVDECPALLTVEYYPEESQTYEQPGQPPYWYPYKHGKEEGYHEHLDILDSGSTNSPFQQRCDRMSEEVWDNDQFWENIDDYWMSEFG